MSEGIQTSTSKLLSIYLNQSSPSAPTAVNKVVYFSDDFYFSCYLGSNEYILPYQILLCFVNPVCSLTGIAVNTLCLAILRKSGLRKPSNILLFSLVVADSMNLFININFADILRYFGPLKSGPNYCTWEYDGQMNRFLEVVHQAFIFIGTWGHAVNATIPIVITIERLLAVYFPVTFKKLVTVKSMFGFCVFAYTLWLAYVIFALFLRRLAYYRLSNGKIVGYVIPTDLLKQNYNTILNFTAYGLEILASWLPSCFICIGCVLIAIKVKMSMNKRRKMANKQEMRKWSPRTTRTLLTTCLIFAVSHAINSTISVVVTFDVKIPIFTFFIIRVSELINIVNCSSNFLVYILSNRHLFQMFLQITANEKQNVIV